MNQPNPQYPLPLPTDSATDRLIWAIAYLVRSRASLDPLEDYGFCDPMDYISLAENHRYYHGDA